MPCAIHGWRPLSVTIQPRRSPRRSRATSRARRAAGTSAYRTASPRHHSHAPTSPAAIIKRPIADHDAEREEHRHQRRTVGRRHALEAGKQAVRVVREDQRAAVRDRDLEHGSSRSSRPARRRCTKRAGLAAVPVRLHGGDLDRLVLQRVEPVLVADEELQRRRAPRACRSPCASWCAPRRRWRPASR